MSAHYAFNCETCGKGFKDKKARQTHIEYAHYGHKRWRCKVCEKAFSAKANVQIHLAVHHLKICQNEKDFMKRKTDMYPACEPYFEKVPFQVIDDSTGVAGVPDSSSISDNQPQNT